MKKQDQKEPARVKAFPAYWYWECPYCQTENEIESSDTSGRAVCDQCESWFVVDYQF